MATESGVMAECAPAAPIEVLRLMRIAAHLNAGAVIALCLWLAWTAADPARRADGADGGFQAGGCECRWTGVSGPQ